MAFSTNGCKVSLGIGTWRNPSVTSSWYAIIIVIAHILYNQIITDLFQLFRQRDNVLAPCSGRCGNTGPDLHHNGDVFGPPTMACQWIHSNVLYRKMRLDLDWAR